MASSSTSSSSSFSQRGAFWLGAAAGAAVGCCATAVLLLTTASPHNSSSSSNSNSNSRSTCSSTNSNSNSGCRSNSEKGVLMMPSCTWLRQLCWWTFTGESEVPHSFINEKGRGTQRRRRSSSSNTAESRREDTTATGNTPEEEDEEEAATAAARGGVRDATTRRTGPAAEDTTTLTTTTTTTRTTATAATAAAAGGGGENAVAAAGQFDTQSKTAARHSEFDAAAAEERGEACPGPGSEGAGAAAACAGCPNRGICSSSSSSSSKEGFKSVKEEIATKLQTVKKKILILSGKGGVGKSTITAQLGWTAASRGLRVGVLDVDVCGPSIPLMMHARQGEVHQSAEGWQPVYVHDKLVLMSIGFLLPDPDAAIVWRGPKKNGLIQQFLADVLWGELDLLLIDTPPGTSDEHLSLVSLLDVDGALVVTTPQEAALQDVRKELNFCTKVGIKVLGVIENMADSVFSLVDVDGAKRMCAQMKVPYAGSVPLDASLLRACEEGVAAVEEYADQPGSQALQKLMTDLLDILGLPQNCEDDEDD